MAEDTMFREAVEALRQGNRARAKELLTLLLKDEQTNAVYWVWMSAAVDSPKERLYCLQTAYKLDPENASAKRGLVLLGALPPDETTQPFPMNRPRLGGTAQARAGKAEGKETLPFQPACAPGGIERIGHRALRRGLLHVRTAEHADA